MKVAYPSDDTRVVERIFAFRKGFEAGSRLAIIHAESTYHADHVREALQVLRRHGPAFIGELLNKAVGHVGRLLRSAWHQLLGRRDMRLQQKVESVEAVGQRGDHSSAPSGGYADDEQVIAARIFAHRLSETSK